MFLLDLGGDGGFSLKTLFFFSFSANNHQLCVAEPPSSSKSLAPSSNLDLDSSFISQIEPITRSVDSNIAAMSESFFLAKFCLMLG